MGRENHGQTPTDVGSGRTLCYIVPVMTHPWIQTATTGLFALALIFASGCGAVVGDSCEVDTDCGTGLACDTTFPDGYCTLGDCQRLGCADKGICVHFDAYTSYCMAPCESADDCRSDYTCISDLGPHDFCGLAAD